MSSRVRPLRFAGTTSPPALPFVTSLSVAASGLAFLPGLAAWGVFAVRTAFLGAGAAAVFGEAFSDAVLRRAARADPEDVTMGFLGKARVC